MKKTASTLRQLAPYMNLGGVLAGCIIIGALFGHWLDTKLGTEPGFLLGGSLFGIASGFYHFFKVVLKKPAAPDDADARDRKDEDRKDGNREEEDRD